MPDCFPEGNAATIGSDTRRSWIKMNGLGPSAGGGGSGLRILQEDDSSAILEEDDATALRKEG